MKSKLLSVIVPIYNSQGCLERCIRSLLSQTYRELEIILVNDGSLDCSGEMCNQYAKEYENIVAVHQKKSGVNIARKKGLQYAKGKYVTFMDSDDWIETNFFEILMSLMMKENADMVTSNVIVETKEGLKKQNSAIKTGLYTKEEINEIIFPNMIYDDVAKKPGIFAYIWGKIMIRDQLIDNIGDLDERLIYGEDGAIIFPMLAKIDKLLVIDYAGYHYIQHDASMTHNLSLDLFHNVKYLEKYLTTKFKTLGKYELVETQIRYFIRDLLYRIIKMNYNIDCGKILCVPPYELIPKDSSLVIYGAGKAGKEFMRLLLQNHYAKVIAWVDQYFEGKMYSYKIEKPENIKDKKYDYILIALTDEKKVCEVKDYLFSIGIDEKKILWKEINWG